MFYDVGSILIKGVLGQEAEGTIFYLSLRQTVYNSISHQQFYIGIAP